MDIKKKISQKLIDGSGPSRLLVEIGNSKNGKLKNVYISKINRKKRLQSLESLEVFGLIKTTTTSVGINAELTPDGLIEYLKLQLNQTEELPDGYVCIVVFDIPETEREIRRLLGSFLDKKVFIRIQRSVWISKFDAAEQLVKIFHLLELDKWVKVYTAREEG